MPQGLVVGSEVVLRLAIMAGGVLAVIWVLLELRVVTVPLFVALLVTTGGPRGELCRDVADSGVSVFGT